MKPENGKFVEYVEKIKNDKLEALQRAGQFSRDSGIRETIDWLNVGKGESDKIKEQLSPQKGEVYYVIELGNDHFFGIKINSEGTIKISGGFRGTTKIRKQDWERDASLVDKALIKAFKHSDTEQYSWF
jgi:hypothetical protein